MNGSEWHIVHMEEFSEFFWHKKVVFSSIEKKKKKQSEDIKKFYEMTQC